MQLIDRRAKVGHVNKVRYIVWHVNKLRAYHFINLIKKICNDHKIKKQQQKQFTFHMKAGKMYAKFKIHAKTKMIFIIESSNSLNYD